MHKLMSVLAQERISLSPRAAQFRRFAVTSISTSRIERHQRQTRVRHTLSALRRAQSRSEWLFSDG
jgi:hypothetical protein